MADIHFGSSGVECGTPCSSTSNGSSISPSRAGGAAGSRPCRGIGAGGGIGILLLLVRYDGGPGAVPSRGGRGLWYLLGNGEVADRADDSGIEAVLELPRCVFECRNGKSNPNPLDGLDRLRCSLGKRGAGSGVAGGRGWTMNEAESEGIGDGEGDG